MRSMTDLMEQLRSYGEFLDTSLDWSISDLDPGGHDDTDDGDEHRSPNRGWILTAAAVVLAAVGLWIVRDDGATDPDLIVDMASTTSSPEVEVAPTTVPAEPSTTSTPPEPTPAQSMQHTDALLTGIGLEAAEILGIELDRVGPVEVGINVLRQPGSGLGFSMDGNEDGEGRVAFSVWSFDSPADAEAFIDDLRRLEGVEPSVDTPGRDGDFGYWDRAVNTPRPGLAEALRDAGDQTFSVLHGSRGFSPHYFVRFGRLVMEISHVRLDDPLGVVRAVDEAVGSVYSPTLSGVTTPIELSGVPVFEMVDISVSVAEPSGPQFALGGVVVVLQNHPELEYYVEGGNPFDQTACGEEINADAADPVESVVDCVGVAPAVADWGIGPYVIAERAFHERLEATGDAAYAAPVTLRRLVVDPAGAVAAGIVTSSDHLDRFVIDVDLNGLVTGAWLEGRGPRAEMEEAFGFSVADADPWIGDVDLDHLAADDLLDVRWDYSAYGFFDGCDPWGDDLSDGCDWG